MTRTYAVRCLTLLAMAGTVAGLAPSAHAILGSFTANDGYHMLVMSGSYNWADVTYYNAGAHGANAGGGPGPTFIAPDAGRWRLTSQAGGFFANTATRNAVVGGAPPYPASNPLGVPVYIVGGHFGGRTDNECLAFRNDMPAQSVGRAVYEYDLDLYDFGGVTPASVTSGVVSHNIYFFANPAVTPQPGVRTPNKFSLGYRDPAFNVGVEWGYAFDNEIMWRAGSGPWNYTGVYANMAWDGMTVGIDLSNQTFTLDYYSATTNTSFQIVPPTPLGAPMQMLTTLIWGMEDGVNTGLGGKNFFDDSSFVIPAPGTAALLAAGLVLGVRRRR